MRQLFSYRSPPRILKGAYRTTRSLLLQSTGHHQLTSKILPPNLSLEAILSVRSPATNITVAWEVDSRCRRQ